jgi:CRP-like cAMP-binding protein
MLPEADIEHINQRFRERGFEAGEPIYYAGDPATRLYIVASGKVKQMRHTLTGQDVLLDILSEGDFFGSLTILGDATYPDSALAQTMVCALSIDAEGFREILHSYPPVALEVLNITGQRLQDAHEAIHQLSAHSVEQRLAYTLLKLADKLGEAQAVGKLIQMPLSRDDLAAMTGATTETISRIMSQFQKEGWIESGRQWVAIRDTEALKEAAAGG